MNARPSDPVMGTLLAGGTTTIESWTQGKVYDAANPSGIYQKGGPLSTLHPKTAELMGGPLGGYFERSKPQYENMTPNDFLSAKLIAKGDGFADDTLALNLLTSVAAGTGRPLYMPAGSYVVRDTVFFPPGLKIVGECWSQIVAQGAKFSEVNNPYVMIRVGNAGDSGTMEIQDLMFTNQGPTAGVVLMEWNMEGSSPGAAAMWDSHFRIGGALGSNLQVANCPKLSGIVNPNCMAGAMLLHLTSTSSSYLENMWAWVADHDLDSGPAQTQIDIYVARGILIESQKASWLYGTASEHCILYQYQLFNAKDLYMGMIQTESPYFFPVPQAPAPFGTTINKFHSDPTFLECPASNPRCRAAWGVRIVQSSNIHIYGSGLYNWFEHYGQACVDSQDCQQRVVEVVESAKIFWYNLYTIGTTEMVNARGRDPITAKSNTNANIHPYLSIINAWLLSASSSASSTDLSGWKDKPACTGHYSNLDDIVNAGNNIPSNCIDKYIAQAEIAIMDRSLQSYSETINNGYDKKFKIYAKQITLLVPSQLEKWMAKAQASGFWKCEETALVVCCKDCSSAQACQNGCENKAGCVTGKRTFTVNCPTKIPNGSSQIVQPKLAYTLTNPDGFYKAVADEYGIDKSWIKLGDFLARAHAGCGGGNPNPVECGKLYNTYWSGFPLAGNVQVKDPKDLIAPNFENNKALRTQLDNELKLSEWDLSQATQGDLVDAGSIPSLLLQQGVSSMAKVVDVADDITEAERKDTIFNFIMGALLLLPGVGALLDAVALTALRSVILLLGALTEVALTVYDIVQDPKNALWLLFGFLMAGGRGNGRSLSQAAGKKRSLSQDDLKGLSPIRGDLDKIHNLRTKCYI
ncbi:hypothetical protein VTL71DRAFT_9477 [Oculimacula yallundae]|uniref:Pectate lyase superfamily protein domain-containing protein n=1 Tax=Oculimacula yallundae TaxID=86028 RepID=A0ABR4BS13_9HELO